MENMITTMKTGIVRIKCDLPKYSEKLKKYITNKNDGDGHYVALAIGILLSVVVGSIVFKAVSGDAGFINGIVSSVNKVITDFITKLTNAVA